MSPVNGMTVVAAGSPFDGLRLYGPFMNSDDAADFAETLSSGTEYHIVPLEHPYADYDGNPRPIALWTGSIEARLQDEVLVTLWPDGDCEVAFRSGLESWGPPETLEHRETR